jgi:hypothetical protein
MELTEAMYSAAALLTDAAERTAEVLAVGHDLNTAD